MRLRVRLSPCKSSIVAEYAKGERNLLREERVRVEERRGERERERGEVRER